MCDDGSAQIGYVFWCRGDIDDMPAKINILVPVLKLMGLKKTVAVTSVAGASMLLSVYCTGCAIGRCRSARCGLGFFILCVGVCHPFHSGCRCSELSPVWWFTSN